MPSGPFHLVLCRNLVFTYYDAELQTRILRQINDRLVPGGILVVGCHEFLPAGATQWVPACAGLPVYGKATDSR